MVTMHSLVTAYHALPVWAVVLALALCGALPLWALVLAAIWYSVPMIRRARLVYREALGFVHDVVHWRVIWDQSGHLAPFAEDAFTVTRRARAGHIAQRNDWRS